MLKSTLICTLLCLFFGTAAADNFNYFPVDVPGNQTLTYSEFTLSYNEEHEQPNWVAYEITKAETILDRDRCECFHKDRLIITKTASVSDYSSTGFDIGHLSPADANNVSDQANRESFLMSNTSPQLPTFNRGIWKKLESWVRNQAIDHSTVYVVSGPVFVNNLGKIGKNKVTIPAYFFKAVLRFDGKEPRTIGFLLPHIGATGDIRKYAVPVNTLETLTGLDFFPELNNSTENLIESRYDLKHWNL